MDLAEVQWQHWLARPRNYKGKDWYYKLGIVCVCVCLCVCMCMFQVFLVYRYNHSNISIKPPHEVNRRSEEGGVMAKILWQLFVDHHFNQLIGSRRPTNYSKFCCLKKKSNVSQTLVTCNNQCNLYIHWPQLSCLVYHFWGVGWYVNKGDYIM